MYGFLLGACRSCGLQKVILKPRIRLRLCRTLIGTSGKWDPDFNHAVRKDIEKHWRSRLKDRDLQNQFLEDGGEKHYVLSMFPYPSGALHMGHVRVYTISDAMARYYRLTGRNVLHPMGWDAFGLPAENAAIDRGEKPNKWTTKNIRNMKQQLEQLSLSFDWDREYATCDPGYYRWTQHFFIKMFEAGLVYQKEAPVNWDPIDQTVLADEQIDDEGRSWRSGAIAEKRLLRQWYIRTTAYSKSLLDGLEDVNPALWRDIIDLQKHWIGKCDGVRIELDLNVEGESCKERLSIFTKTPELLHGASHILIAPHHPLNRIPYVENTESEECRLQIEAVNPLTGKLLPLYLSSCHNFGDHLDAHIGIPSAKKSDRIFAENHNLDYTAVVDVEKMKNDIVINSGQFTGLVRKEAFSKVAQHLKSIDHGGYVTSERSRDWLISRQRYWGTPIPIIQCDDCGAVPVPYDDLPVQLPELEQLTGKGMSPLTQATDWRSVPCPKCGSAAQRETDTMDTFVDSSWYYLRYTDAKNTNEPFNKEKAYRIMPVDLYIGGKEHAIMHLYYARFFTHFLHDCGLVPTREPFVNLLTQGMVMGQSYCLDSGRYIPLNEVDNTGAKPVQRGTGAALNVQWEKMSKSKYNGVDPQDVLDEYGTDSTRLCILSGVAPKTERHWDANDMVGVLRWQARVWSLVTTLRKVRQDSELTSSSNVTDEEHKKWEQFIWDARNATIKDVSWNMSKTFLINVTISTLHAFTRTLLRVPAEVMAISEQYERGLAELIIMIAPFAPMYASEMWTGLAPFASKTLSKHGFQWDKDVLSQRWPVNDSDYHLSVKVKRGHDDCFEVPLPVTIGKEDELSRHDYLTLVKSHQDFDPMLGDLKPERFGLKIQPAYKVVMTYTESKKEAKARKEREKKRKKQTHIL